MLVVVDNTSGSSIAVGWLDLRRDRFAGVESCMRMAERSPPETALLRPSFTKPTCGDMNDEKNVES